MFRYVSSLHFSSTRLYLTLHIQLQFNIQNNNSKFRFRILWSCSNLSVLVNFRTKNKPLSFWLRLDLKVINPVRRAICLDLCISRQSSILCIDGNSKNMSRVAAREWSLGNDKQGLRIEENRRKCVGIIVWDVTSYSSQCPVLAREWAWRDFGVVRLLQTEEGGHWGLCTALHCCHPAERSFVLTRPQCPSQAPPPFLVRYLCCGQYAQSSLLCSWFCCWNSKDHRPTARTGARKSLLRDSILCSKDEPISFC